MTKKLRVSDIFDLPMERDGLCSVSQLWVVKDGDTPVYSSIECEGIKEAEIVTHAVNMHDKMTARIDELECAMHEIQGELESLDNQSEVRHIIALLKELDK